MDVQDWGLVVQKRDVDEEAMAMQAVRQVWRHSRLLSRVWMFSWDAYLAVWVPLARVWMWLFHRQWLRDYDAGQEKGALTSTPNPVHWDAELVIPWDDGKVVHIFDSNTISARNYKEVRDEVVCL